MERIVAVYDVDPVYGERLVDYMNQKETLPFTAMVFTDPKRLEVFGREHTIEILLVNEEAREQIREVKAQQKILLCENRVTEKEEEQQAVYKYQSGDSILREVMACYACQPAPALTLVGERAVVMGVYSPVNRCLKTSLALTLGQLLARREAVLYLSLEEYSGFSGLVSGDYSSDLSDVLYLYRQGTYNWLRLKAMVYSRGNLDYIPPVRYGEDLNQVSPEDFALLIDRIARESGYDKIILDVGQMGKGALSILPVCNVIYMPVKEDYISQCKLEEFETYLEEADDCGIRERIQKVKLPYHNSFGSRDSYMEQLVWGELGDFARQLLGGVQ